MVRFFQNFKNLQIVWVLAMFAMQTPEKHMKIVEKGSLFEKNDP